METNLLLQHALALAWLTKRNPALTKSTVTIWGIVKDALDTSEYDIVFLEPSIWCTNVTRMA